MEVIILKRVEIYKIKKRNYFGPVNIQRMSIKLVSHNGDVIDLNNTDWSFTFICEQLYRI
jgi:hypothetical protein